MQKLNGRLSKIAGKAFDIWLDGGHNLDAAEMLSKEVNSWDEKKIILIIGMINGKDPVKFLNKLGGKIKIVKRKIFVNCAKSINRKISHKVILDRIELGTYLIAAALVGKKIVINKINPSFVKSEIQILKKMGVRITVKGETVIILKSDKIKKINDIYGHHQGDQVLIEIAQCLSENLRGEDIIGRFGGEEFILLLPHTDIIQAEKIAERCRHALQELPVFSTQNNPIHISASFGVSSSAFAQDPYLVIRQADQALYAVKASGRNQVRTFHQSEAINSL